MTPAAPRPADAPHERRRAGGARRALSSLGSLGIAALVLMAALSGVGGTYAMWSDQQTVDAGTLSAGTAALEATWNGAAPSADAMLPGDSATREAQLHNSGDVPLALSIAATADTAGFEVRAGGTCEAATRAAVAGASAVPLAAAEGGALVLQPGERITACIAVTATPALAPGAQVNLTLDIEGTQVR